MSPLVSLVLTTYNRQQFLGSAIASVLQQTAPNFELLVWDDGSTDGSVELAQAYARQDARVQVVAAPHQGRVAALSQAIAQTTGTYLGWVDSDDLLAPTALAATTRILSARPAVGMVYTDYIEMDETGHVLGYGHRCATPYSKERLLVEFMTFHFRLLRRSLYDKVGGINHALDFVEDYDLCLRLSEVTQIQRVHQPLYYYRVHPNSASQQFHLEQTLRTHTILKQALQRRGMAATHTIDLQLPMGRFILRQKTSFKRNSARLAPLFASFPLIGAISTGTAQAQSITPATDGTNTIVTPAGNRFDITGGTTSGNGANLFHSFERFGLTQGQIANFIANPQLQNILGRVVGNNPSIIDGLIQITGGTPNLYLLNPAGIVFGANAQLNVPGAFTATTANGVGFGCGAAGLGCEWFNATGNNNYAVLGGTPNGFGFTSPQPGTIVNAGNLAVSSGQSIALIGGTVINTGQLTAPGGQILLSAVPGEKLVRLSQPGNLLSLEVSALPAAPASPSLAPSLPQLLTGGGLTSASGLTVNPDGSVALTSSGTTIPTIAGTTIASGQLSTVGKTSGGIAVLGDRVGVIGATIDASGKNGGSVNIGGGYQGKGSLPTAQATYVDRASTIRADGLAPNSSGGNVIVWADGFTVFRGNISARGGARGSGGFVEVSGKDTLSFRGTVDTTAPNGQTGTLLLDPLNITIISGGPGADDAQVADNQILFGDGGNASFTISEVALEALAGNANVILQALNNITINTLADNTLVFAPGTGSISFEAGGAISMNPANTISAPGRNVSFTGNSLTLGTINTSAPIGATANGGNITLRANSNITTAELIGNGYNVGGTASGGTIDVRSTNGTIAAGNIVSTIGAGSFPAVSGGTVNLVTSSNGGDISFQSIDTRGGFGFAPAPANGGNVTVSARGQVRGSGLVATSPGDTIATNGVQGGSNGTVTITHDGGPTNQSFTIANGAVTPATGNGTIGAINTGSEILSGQTLDFPSSPFTSTGGNIRVTFTNDTPTVNLAGALPSTTLNQPINFTLASLSLSTFDLNADSPLFVRVFAIAPGAVLRVNGVAVAPGAVIPANATLQFIPPPGFVGLLANAFSVTVDDVISTSPPRGVAITVNAGTDFNNPCILTVCNANIPNDPIDNGTNSDVILSEPPEERFTNEFAAYLGIPPTTPATIDEQKEILRQIERETGARPAFLYISFVPVVLKASQINQAGQTSISEQPTDQLEVLVVTAQGNAVRRRIPGATRATVLKLANDFRQEITDPRKTLRTTYLKPAQQLYQWLVAPVVLELQGRRINNLVFLMDAGLRSLPVAALHNGQQFLIEQYSIGLMPSVSLTDTRYQDIKQAQLLSLGISESTQEQAPLPSVLLEVSTIVQKLWSGQAFLNQAATPRTLRVARQARPYGIIHLATHADFLPGKLSNSFIQLWDDRLRVDQLRQLGWNDPQVQLLVLSACSTALGDREAELGFGGLAVQAGVKTAIASLWAINDVGTAALITRFYKDLQTAPIKAEALRQAQLAMLKGQVYIKDSKIQGVESSGLPLPADVGVGDLKLSHPYYWSAFTVIGSPW